MDVGTRTDISQRSQQETMKSANWRDHISKPHFRKITDYMENKFKKGEAEGSTARRLWSLPRHELGVGLWAAVRIKRMGMCETQELRSP